MTNYEQLLWRGYIKDVSNEELAKELINHTSVKFYIGYDPTAPSLHIGHLAQIVKMDFLRRLGHIPCVVIGGATGLIGDPKPTNERQLLGLEEALVNAQFIHQQIKAILGTYKTLYFNNYDWLKNIDLFTYLRDFGKHFNLNTMLAKEIVATRLETGITYTEFSYMVLQAIDWWYLFKNHQVNVQFGGSDQWGNIIAGLDLIKKIEGDTKLIAFTSPLLTKSDGTKFGKSESGTIWLDKAKTSPYELYQFLLNSSDDDVINYLKCLTLLEKTEIEEIERVHLLEKGKRFAQKRLAGLVVEYVHKSSGLEEAIILTNAMFNSDFIQLTKHQFAEVFKISKGKLFNENVNVIDALITFSLATSKREARELIQNKAITLNDTVISDLEFTLSKESTYIDGYFVLKKGKKRFVVGKFI